MSYLEDARLGLPWEGQPPTLRQLRALYVPFGLRYKLEEAFKAEDLALARIFLQEALDIIKAIEEKPSPWEEVRALQARLDAKEPTHD